MKTVASRVMKKFFIAVGLMMAAIVALVSCQPKETYSETLTMTITASSDLTKTSNDGLSTLWAEGDQLHVFYLDPSVASHASYVKAGVFTLSEGVGSKSGTFTGEVASTPSAATTWYAIYTGSSSAAPLTPAASAAQDGFIYLGRSNGINQSSYDDMSAVSGSHCPMFGCAANVPANSSPAFSMKQMASVVEFKIVNNTGGTLIVNSLELNEFEDIAGQFYADVTGSEPVFVAVDGKAIKNPVVNITKPTEINNGGSAKIYMPLKPFKHAPVAGMTVKISGSVNGNSGSKSISLNPSTDAQSTFAAGKIKTVTVNVSGLDILSAGTVKQALEGTVGEEHLVSEAIVTWANNNSVLITDNTGTILVYKSSHGLALGDAVKVAGKTKAYNHLVEFDAPSIEKVSKTINPSLSVKNWSVNQILAVYNNAAIEYIQAEIPFTTASNGQLGDSDIVLYVTKATGVSISKNKTYKITGFIYGWTDYTPSGSSTTTKEVCMYVDSATEVQAQEATLTVEPSSVSFEQTGGSETVTVTSDNNNWTFEKAAEADWLTVSKSGSTLTLSAGANEGAKRSVKVVVKHSNGTLTKNITVNQDGAIEEDVLNLGAASISFSSTDTEAKKVKVTCNSSAWSVDRSTVPDWLTVEEFRETVDEAIEYYITVKASVNTGEARNAEITVLHPNGTLSRKLAVGQNAASTGGTKTYTRVTSANSLTSGEYIIVYAPESGNCVAMNGGLTTLDAASNGVVVTISGNSISYKGDDIYFTYNASEGSFKGAGGSYLAHKDKKNYIASATEYSETTCKMTVTFDGDNAVITAPTDYVIKYNANSGQERFRFYTATSSSKPVQLFKKN